MTSYGFRGKVPEFADAKRVDIGYLDFAITCIKYSWEYQGGKCTGLLSGMSWDYGSYNSQEQNMNSVKIEVLSQIQNVFMGRPFSNRGRL